MILERSFPECAQYKPLNRRPGFFHSGEPANPQPTIPQPTIFRYFVYCRVQGLDMGELRSLKLIGRPSALLSRHQTMNGYRVLQLGWGPSKDEPNPAVAHKVSALVQNEVHARMDHYF